MTKKVPRTPSFVFNECANDRSPVPERGLTFVIRTDAAFATAKLRRNIVAHIQSDPEHPLHGKENLDNYITKITHGAYELWGQSVLTAKAECLDYGKYHLKEPEDKSLHVHFYNAATLTTRAIEMAETMLAARPDHDAGKPTMFISLDDMIQKQCEPWADIGFSRLFDHEGKEHFGYTGRPGMLPLSEQIKNAKAQLKELSEKHGGKISVVLLEDNVRHARMLNWVIDMLDQEDFFDYADLAGISTCFCCASEEERAAIQYDGKTIPLAIVIDYEQNLVDVCTPRDLLLDGFVVEVNNKVTRLPGIFADVIERFKINPKKVDKFNAAVIDANIEFCQTLESAFQLKLPVAWFKGADAIEHIYGATQQTPMADVMEELRRKLSRKPGNDNAPASVIPIAAKNGPNR
ncbi:MAG: hypothetical protein H6867_06340 [Rhodospirillales bacterium]|nr:hypothetical protein [Rhodospirillales bacterium]MCB9995150.1 hypothetical protein [Rhodospirillales bacterium]